MLTNYHMSPFCCRTFDGLLNIHISSEQKVDESPKCNTNIIDVADVPSLYEDIYHRHTFYIHRLIKGSGAPMSSMLSFSGRGCTSDLNRRPCSPTRVDDDGTEICRNLFHNIKSSLVRQIWLSNNSETIHESKKIGDHKTAESMSTGTKFSPNHGAARPLQNQADRTKNCKFETENGDNALVLSLYIHNDKDKTKMFKETESMSSSIKGNEGVLLSANTKLNIPKQEVIFDADKESKNISSTNSDDIYKIPTLVGRPHTTAFDKSTLTYNIPTIMNSRGDRKQSSKATTLSNNNV